MKMICFRLNEQEYKLAKQNAIAQGVDSINVLAKKRVLEADTKPERIHANSGVSKAVKACLYPYEIELVQRNAKVHGMSLSREIAFRVRQTLLKDEVCLYPQEIEELKQLKTAVNRIGRNIHHIITGDRLCTVNDAEFQSEAQEVIALCRAINKQLEALTTRVVNRFG